MGDSWKALRGSYQVSPTPKDFGTAGATAVFSVNSTGPRAGRATIPSTVGRIGGASLSLLKAAATGKKEATWSL